MTKKILLGLGATTALVGTSFAIVSCADDSTPAIEATIAYNQDAFNGFKELYGPSNFITEITKPYNKEILDAIFTSSRAGAIAKIDVVNSYSNSGINVKFTLTPAKGFTLNKTTFDIAYADGSIVNKTEAKITYNQKAFEESKSILGEEDVTDQSKYLTEIVKDSNKETLNSIFSSNIEGAIESISVTSASENKNVKFTLIANDGFTLDKTTFEIVYIDGTVAATITFNQNKFEASKGDMTQPEYLEAMKNPDNKTKLDAIFTSSEEGAIANIEVANSTIAADTNVKFTLTPAEGFTLNQSVFDIVYANEPQEPAKTKATITFNRYKFEASKTFYYSPKSQEVMNQIIANYTQPEYIKAMKKPENKAKLFAIFEFGEFESTPSVPEGAIESISVYKASDKNVKFTLTAAEGFTLNQTEFYIVYDSGLPAIEATITYNKDKFIESKKNSEETDMSPTMSPTINYLHYINEEKATLYSIFSSNIEGAIADIVVEDSDSNNVIMFFLKPAEGFTLDKSYFLIDFATGSLVDDLTPEKTGEAAIIYNQDAFNDSKKISESLVDDSTLDET